MGELRKILEYLKKDDEPKTFPQVTDHFGWDVKKDKDKRQRIHTTYFDHPERKYILEVKKKVGKERPTAYIPSSKGIFYLEESKLSDRKHLHSKVMVGATIVIAFASFVSVIVAVQNSQILSLTAIPNDIDLLIELDGKNTLNLYDLTDDVDENENLRICVTNRGRIEAEVIELSWQSEWTPHHPAELGDLSGGERRCTFLNIECNDCAINTDREFMPQFAGPRELIVRADCPNCKGPVFDSFDVCIYNNRSKDCPAE